MSSANFTKIDPINRKDVVEKIIAYANHKVVTDEAELFTSFIRQYFSNIPLEDLSIREVEYLFGTAYSHWQLLKTRKLNESKIRVFNPSKKEGWTSTHTIVEVINDDMPFLVDSLRMEINRLGFTIHLIIHSGGMKVYRDADGQITKLFPFDSNVKDAIIEAPIYFEIDKQTDSDVLNNITDNLQRILKDVRLAVNDWPTMKERAVKIIDEMSNNKLPLDSEILDESLTFLRWLVNDHFTFLGSREYEVVEIDGRKALKLIKGTGLGVLKDEERSKVIRYFDELPPEARNQALSKQVPILISKSNTFSTVHRPVYTDYLGCKLYDENGEIVRFVLFIGLYTSDAYNSKLSDIPFIRRKEEMILKKSGLTHSTHALKTLTNILDTFPRDDIFQGNVDMLSEIVVGILHLQDRKRIRLFVLPDVYGRYISCLVYIPRDNLNTDLIYKMQAILMNAFHGHKVSFTTYFPESVLARVHFLIRVDPKKKMDCDIKKIEEQLVEIARSWSDGLQEEILAYFGEEIGSSLVHRYIRAFPAGYRDTNLSRNAIYDIENLEKLTPDHDLELSIYRPSNAKTNNIRLKLYRLNNTIPLSDVLPILENMGLRIIEEQPFQINFEDKVAWINDFNMLYCSDTELNIDEIKDIFQEAFHYIWRGFAENDAFNKLVLSAHLSWREISVLRAYAKYLRQIGFTFSQDYIEESFNNNPAVARLIVELFNLTFNPNIHKKLEKISQIEETLYEALDNVANLDEDRILRRYMEVIKATLRTNFFQHTSTGEFKTYLSFKLNSSLIPDIPLPIPMYETFVYSTDFEGVHLRAGKVARGGLRWSNRREDFRTEILGLMKAQQVKNAIIVPSGAKGGFVVKNIKPDATRETVMKTGISCYKNFIRGLLDLADNLVGGSIVRPKETVCFDDEDPYLVVAADKGTATFSDIANKISEEYHFWLGDAFASGGSAGYDHKKMGITAKGAWESVKDHFGELNINPYQDEFTVVGIGDMAGDVFGNGLLYTDRIKLIAAFNHTHIFIDPNPDSKASYNERSRLFNLPSSTWEDYDQSLISKGGAVFSRSVKSIKLSPEAREALGIDKEAIIPNDLIRSILKAPVDLFWNGGIGTYVKACSETHSEIGDRANDLLRINGNELQCRVVAEGGNLGFTQLGRIEYELSGGKINTDFIDNSAGVDCSDHEVNIKILLNQLITKQHLKAEERNSLLAAMTEEVAQLVLYNNYCQTRAITFSVSNSMEYLDLYGLFMRYHETNGSLNRSLEFLPDDKALNERKANNKGLTRPEIAVLMAYSKIILKKEILNSNLPEEPALAEYVEFAFPLTLCKRFAKEMQHHHLKREIIATQISNRIVMEMGITFVFQMNDENNASAQEIVRAYLTARKLFKLDSLWTQIESLEQKVPPHVLNDMALDIMRLGRRATRWLLLNKRHEFDIVEMVKHFSSHLNKVNKILPTLLFGHEKNKLNNRIKHLISEGVPEEIATHISSTRPLYSSLNIIQAAITNEVSVIEVAKIYFKVMERLELIWFREKINDYPVDNHWAVLARADYKGDLDYLQRVLTVSVIKSLTDSNKIEDHVEKWFEFNRKSILKWKAILGELRSSSTNEFAMLTVAMRELLELAQISRVHDQMDLQEV